MIINSAYISLLLLLIVQASPDAKPRHRDKRHLVFIQGGGYKLVIGIAVPYKVAPKRTIIIGLNFQYQYALPTNITQLEKDYPPIIARSKRKRELQTDVGRTMFYKGVESTLNRYGLNGEQCLLRTICDNAMDPVNHRANGIYGQLMHIAFTPRSRDGVQRLDDIYIDAQMAGEFGVDCVSLYPGCPEGLSIMDVLTVLDN